MPEVGKTFLPRDGLQPFRLERLHGGLLSWPESE
jgi:hypothetical protein